MKPADDARVIDTTGLSLDRVIARIEREIVDRPDAGPDLPVKGEHPEGRGLRVKTALDAASPDATASVASNPRRRVVVDRSWPAWLWYRIVQFSVATLLSVMGVCAAPDGKIFPHRGECSWSRTTSAISTSSSWAFSCRVP